MTAILLIVCFALIAFLYASVGHGGASGYLAVMAILGYTQQFAKPNALLLNIAVSCLAFYHYYRRGYFRTRDFLWLAAFSVPLAWLGGLTKLTDNVYHNLLAAMLLLAAISLLFRPAEAKDTKTIPAPMAALCGALIGWVSGLTGIGGGVILSPVLLLAGWANQKQTAALSAAFILVNSISGFMGWLGQKQPLDPNLICMLPVAIAGGFVGSFLGANRFQSKHLKWLLCAVLLVASIRLFIN